MEKSKKKGVSKSQDDEVTRRTFLTGSGMTLSGAVFFRPGLARSEFEGVGPSAEESAVSHIELRVNGIPHRIEVPDYATLAEVLRDELGLTGVKIGCNRGECGACTVQLNGRAVYSCSKLAALEDGSEITTVEGLAQGETLHPLQQAFTAHDGLQCGFCTPGQIMAAKALLDGNPSPTEHQVKRGLSGNLCRCGCYNHIVQAVLDAAARLKSREATRHG